MREGVRKWVLAGVFVVGLAGFIGFSEWSSEKRAREGDASQVELACVFGATAVLAEQSVLRTGRFGSMYRQRVTWVDTKTGARAARVYFGVTGRLIGCDADAVWLVSEEGQLEAWSPAGVLLASQSAMRALPPAPLQLKEAHVHRDGGLMLRGNDARLYRATAADFTFAPLGKQEEQRWESRVWQTHSNPTFEHASGRYDLHGSPLGQLRRERTELAIAPPYEQGFIKATAFSDLILPAGAGFGVVLFVSTGLADQSAVDALRVDLEPESARVAWKQALGIGRPKQGARVGDLLLFLVEPGNDDDSYRLRALETKTGKPAWSYKP